MSAWTFCRTCGERTEGEHERCPHCMSANVRVVNTAWAKAAEATGDIFPGKEEQG